MSINLTKLTLQELKRQKLAWVKESEDLLIKLAYAVLESSEKAQKHTRTYQVIRLDGYSFYACDNAECFDVHKDQYKHSISLVVEKHDRTLAFYCFFIDPAYDPLPAWQENWLCIPGQWMDTARKIVAEASQKRTAAENEREESERQALLKRMSVIDRI